MISATSIRSRFAFTAVFSAVRMALSFFTGLLIARTLGPENYGNYMFLIGSFLGIRQLLDLGTSTAFYTFLCQRPRGSKFILSYIVWQGIQLLIAVLLIGLIFPDQILELMWLKQDRGHIVLAFLSVFISQQVNLTITQIGESLRKTQRVQILNFVGALVLFTAVLVTSRTGWLTVTHAFWMTIATSTLSILFAFRFIPIELSKESELWIGREVLNEYVKYCSPLVVYTMISFVYTFADTWLLQRFGGAVQQGFYSVANQFSIAGLFATSAMLNIFWKETAEMHQTGAHEHLISIYQKTTRFLFIAGAAICGILSPWSKEIAVLSLGPAYSDGAIILAIMFLYPVYQCINQLNSTVFYATGRTREYVVYGSVFMLGSVIVSFFVQTAGAGAMGMALKMVGFNLVGATVTSIWLAKLFSFRWDWKHQLGGIALCFGWGYICADLCRRLIAGEEMLDRIPALGMMGVSALIYFGVLVLIVWKFPKLIGFQNDELQEMTKNVFGRIKAFRRVQ